MTAPVLTFLGAAGTVTGSRFLLEHGTRLLVEAGLYQGVKTLRLRNWDPFPVDPGSVQSALLTHAHLDHCGYLPRLVKQGFAGPVLCTEETAELVAVVLRDSAHLMEEDARYANAVGFSRHRVALPLYDAADVEKSLGLLAPVLLHEPVSVGGPEADVVATLRSAGHILGAATALVNFGTARVVFSGDLGRQDHPIVGPPEDPPAADVVVVESTYGDRRHTSGPPVLADAIRRTIGRGGSVLVPAFAVDRTELVLLEIGRLMQQGLVPAVPVHVDSPMALAVLDLYRRRLQDAGAAHDFGIPDLRVARSVAQSQLLNRPDKACIVVSASGMATGGRVLHHLVHQLPDRRNCVVLAGYQAHGTRGRALAAGAREVKIHGRYVPVRAEVVQDESFSAHADADEVLAWLGRIPEAPRTVFVVHGEPAASSALASRIQRELGWTAVVPSYGERVRLS
jgi:metallo-beta-lactamase family protein